MCATNDRTERRCFEWSAWSGVLNKGNQCARLGAWSMQKGQEVDLDATAGAAAAEQACFDYRLSTIDLSAIDCAHHHHQHATHSRPSGLDARDGGTNKHAVWHLRETNSVLWCGGARARVLSCASSAAARGNTQPVPACNTHRHCMSGRNSSSSSSRNSSNQSKSWTDRATRCQWKLSVDRSSMQEWGVL